MAMFDKDEKVISGPGTVIGSNVKLVGALRDVNDIAVHGTIEGEVGSEKNVMIGETAQVKGPVAGTTVSIAGVVRGTVEATTRLEVLATGKIYGDIVTKDLIIRSGALFVGKCSMPEDQGPKTKNPESTKAAEATSPSENKPNYEVE